MEKKKTLQDLKNFLDNLDEKQLKQPLFVCRKQLDISGIVNSVEELPESLYWDGEDDPSELLTKNQYEENGLEKCDVELMIKKGSIVLKF